VPLRYRIAKRHADEDMLANRSQPDSNRLASSNAADAIDMALSVDDELGIWVKRKKCTAAKAEVAKMARQPNATSRGRDMVMQLPEADGEVREVS
jgi:hypothetical protein